MGNAILMQQRERALGGESPRRRGDKKDLKALEWVWRWDWSSPTIVDQVASPTRRGVARRLIDKGLLKEQLTSSGGAKGSAATVVALTPDGRAIVEAGIEDLEKLVDYQGLRTYRPMQMRHDLLVQRAIARWVTEGSISDYRTPSEIAEQSQPGAKHPDAIFIDHDGERVALELELTKKAARRMDDFAWGVVKALEQEQYDEVAIFSPSNAILKAYQKRFQPNAQVKVWRKDQRGRAVQKGSERMPDWVMDQVIFEGIEL